MVRVKRAHPELKRTEGKGVDTWRRVHGGWADYPPADEEYNERGNVRLMPAPATATTALDWPRNCSSSKILVLILNAAQTTIETVNQGQSRAFQDQRQRSSKILKSSQMNPLPNNWKKRIVFENASRPQPIPNGIIGNDPENGILPNDPEKRILPNDSEKESLEMILKIESLEAIQKKKNPSDWSWKRILSNDPENRILGNNSEERILSNDP